MVNNEEIEKRVSKLEEVIAKQNSEMLILKDQLKNIMEWLGKVESELKMKASINHSHSRDVHSIRLK